MAKVGSTCLSRPKHGSLKKSKDHMHKETPCVSLGCACGPCRMFVLPTPYVHGGKTDLLCAGSDSKSDSHQEFKGSTMDDPSTQSECLLSSTSYIGWDILCVHTT
eukprot:1124627-Pelagomonas_calceolata.AAC.6